MDCFYFGKLSVSNRRGRVGNLSLFILQVLGGIACARSLNASKASFDHSHAEVRKILLINSQILSCLYLRLIRKWTSIWPLIWLDSVNCKHFWVKTTERYFLFIWGEWAHFLKRYAQLKRKYAFVQAAYLSNRRQRRVFDLKPPSRWFIVNT